MPRNNVAKMSQSEKLCRARCRMEESAMDLLSSAESYTNQESRWDRRCSRVNLLEAARKYARAVESLTRARKSPAAIASQRGGA